MSVVGAAIAPDGAKAADVRRPALREIVQAGSFGKVVCVMSATDADRNRRKSFAEKDVNVLRLSEEGEVLAETDLSGLASWPPRSKVRWTCRKGLKPEAPNQDSFSIMVSEGDYAIYGVYDGHGPCGHDISDYAHEFLMATFVAHPRREEAVEQALLESFEATQKKIREEKSLDPSTSGTTCTVAYHDYKKDQLWIAHIGDSRAVFGTRNKNSDAFDKASIRELTIDHKPNLPLEKKRIEESDPPGRVVFDGYYNHRVFSQKGMYPGLNMSRAFGDIVAHDEAGLVARPDVVMIDVAKEREKFKDLTLLLCSDGVWEFIDPQEALKHFEFPDNDGVEKLAQKSFQSWMNDSEGEISDDITVICVKL